MRLRDRRFWTFVATAIAVLVAVALLLFVVQLVLMTHGGGSDITVVTTVRP